MAMLVRNVECPACRKRHNFVLAGAGWDGGAAYEYVCPQTTAKTTLHLGPTAMAEESAQLPAGAVGLTPKAK